MQTLVSIEEVMQRYMMQRDAASRLMHRLPCFRVGKRLFVRAADLDEYERQKTVYPAVSKPHSISRRRA